jgi:uncharacterized membrane protein HdeD (DUF308 family)
MSAKETKVYDYAPERVRDQLLDVFRKRKGEATSADLVALTGLPKVQVEAEVKAVSDEYGARLRVTESGEILYSFPSGFRSRYRGLFPSLKRFWKTFKKGAAAVGSFLFKIWIVVMLVGYFLLFLALALLALLASVAASASGRSDSRDDRRGGGLGGLMIAGRLLDAIMRIWLYSELARDPRDRAYRSERRKERRPLHKAIFSFVFGDGDPDSAWESAEKKAFVAFVQANRGIVTLPEFLAISGLSPAEAEARISRFMYEFEGSPEVTEGGTIYYSFPSLLRKRDKADRTFGFAVPMRRIAPFSSNPKKMNTWFCVINAVNLVFGSYFLAGSLASTAVLPLLYGAKYASRIVMTAGWDGFYLFVHQLLGKLAGMADPVPLIALGLGAVPIAFSALFYLVPALRSARLAARNERARLENLRRVACRVVLDSPEAVRAESVAAASEAAGDAARPKDGGAPARILDELAAWAGADVKEGGAFSFEEVARSKVEAQKARAAVDPAAYELGGAVFDSHS